MTFDDFIRRTFTLASKAQGSTWPNPLVGAVIVKNGKIIGEGFHHKAGEDHAEVDAFKNCKESPEGATLFVNLEPCCHTNKTTPPCAQRVITEKIKKVVICNLDPNPEVNGKGVELLRQNGIEVEYGILAVEGELLNEAFFHAQRKKRPFVHLKMATSLDGRIALPSGESQWITSEAARNHVHLLRSQYQAIAVGAETARKDNPKLSVRLDGFKNDQPWRIVFTRSGNLPPLLSLFTDDLKSKTLVYTQKPVTLDFPHEQVKIVQNLDEAMYDLFQKKIITLFVEGGSLLAASLMQEKLVNRISLYQNPSFLGAGPSALSDFGLTKLSERPKLQNIQSQWIGEDFYLTGKLTQE